MYFLPVLEIRNPKSRCQQAHALPRGSGGPTAHLLLGSGDGSHPWPEAAQPSPRFSGHIAISLCLHGVFPWCMPVTATLLLFLWGYESYWIKGPTYSNMTSGKHMTSANIPSLNKVTVWGSGKDRNWGLPCNPVSTDFPWGSSQKSKAAISLLFWRAICRWLS